MFRFSKGSIDNLMGVDHRLVLVVSRGLLYSPIDFKVQEGIRSKARQVELVKQGRSKTLHSKHLFGKAIDLVAVGDINRDGRTDHMDRKLVWDPDTYHTIANAMMRASSEVGIPIRWGGDWDFNPETDEDFFDGPHFELVGV